MADGRPAIVRDFLMQARPEHLKRAAFKSSTSYPFQEDWLQWLLDTTPEVLPVRDFYPSVSSLCSLGREIPVDLGGKWGYIDNLFVSNDAHLVLVETKLFRNPEAVRDVISQVYQYGEAVNSINYVELENAVRRGQKTGTELRADETIASRVRSKEADGSFVNLIDDFEDRLAANIRTGEVLYLIVADEIRTSVERLALWLNELSGSAPHRFGLVEVRAYTSNDGSAVIVPRTLVRTKEVSRHVVVIETRSADAVISASVVDRTGTETGAVAITSRAVSTQGTSLSKERLLSEVQARSLAAFDVLTSLVQGLEAAAFDSRALATELQYGFTYPKGEGEFTPLVSLLSSSLYSNLRSKVVGVIGNAEFAAYKRRLSLVAPFYQDEEVSAASKKFGHAQRYEVLAGREREFIIALIETRRIALDALLSISES